MKSSDQSKEDASDQATVDRSVNHEQQLGSMRTSRLWMPTTIKIKKGKEIMQDETLSSISVHATKKGFVLMVTLMMLVIISLVATMLWHSSNTEMLIAGNSRRAMHAKHSASSGINHFMAMDFYADDVYEMLGNMNEAQIINTTTIPGTKQSYDVKVTTCCDQMEIDCATAYSK